VIVPPDSILFFKFKSRNHRVILRTCMNGNYELNKMYIIGRSHYLHVLLRSEYNYRHASELSKVPRRLIKLSRCIVVVVFIL